MTLRKYLVLAGVTILSAVGDTLLSRGMRATGGISLDHISSIFLFVLHPELALGILFLLGFFACYINALSWADLTFVLPATSLSYVLITLVGRFLLHEHVSISRWIGVLLISGGVGFVTQGPELTHRPQKPASDSRLSKAAAEASR